MGRIILHCEGDNLEHLVQEVNKALGLNIATGEPLAPETTPAQPAAGSKRGPGRPKTTETQPTPPPPAQPPAPAATGPAKLPTLDDVRAAFKTVLDGRKPGERTNEEAFKRCAEIVGKFGVKKVNDLKPEDFGKAITTCQQVAAEVAGSSAPVDHAVKADPSDIFN